MSMINFNLYESYENILNLNEKLAPGNYVERHHLNYYIKEENERDKGNYNNFNNTVKLLRPFHIYIHLLEALMLYDNGKTIPYKDKINLRLMLEELEWICYGEGEKIIIGNPNFERKRSYYKMVPIHKIEKLIVMFKKYSFIFKEI